MRYLITLHPSVRCLSIDIKTETRRVGVAMVSAPQFRRLLAVLPDISPGFLAISSSVVHSLKYSLIDFLLSPSALTSSLCIGRNCSELVM